MQAAAFDLRNALILIEAWAPIVAASVWLVVGLVVLRYVPGLLRDAAAWLSRQNSSNVGEE